MGEPHYSWVISGSLDFGIGQAIGCVFTIDCLKKGGLFAKALVFHTYVQSPFQLLSTQEWGWPNAANKIGPLSSLNKHGSLSRIFICNLPTSHPSFWKWTGPQTRGRRLWRGATWRQTWPPVSSATPAQPTRWQSWQSFICELTNDTWREECEERDIVSRLGASLLALIRSSIWWDEDGNNDCDEDEDLGISYTS